MYKLGLKVTHLSGFGGTDELVFEKRWDGPRQRAGVGVFIRVNHELAHTAQGQVRGEGCSVLASVRSVGATGSEQL